MGIEGNDKRTFIMFLLAFLIGFFVVSFVEVLRSSYAPSSGGMRPAGAVSLGESVRAPASFADLTDKVKPAVVNISTTKLIRPGRGMLRAPFGEDAPFGGDEFFNRFFGRTPSREFKQKSLGSGFIISHDGYIFTNNHVVEQAEKIIVRISDGREYEAKVIGKDAKTDLALIKIKPTESLPVVEIGDSEKLRVGDWVIAIGNPFGLEQTVTAGIVSAKGRVIGAGPYDNFIQTDASINPGNSGGPLFNMEGKVVGINTAIVAQGQGIGFAIPIDMAKAVLADLKSKGKVTRGWLGISVQDVSEDMVKTMKLKNRNGAVISDVFKGDPADKAGIRAGDVVVEVNGQAIKDTHELLLKIAALRVGEKIAVKAIRDGAEKTFEITVAERTEQAEMAAEKRSDGADDLGMVLQDITPDVAKYLGLQKRGGVIVVDVKDGGIADDVGIQPKDIILEVNKVKISSMKEYVREMSKRKPKDSILFLVKRGRTTFYVAIR
jgi:serine protease Do